MNKVHTVCKQVSTALLRSAWASAARVDCVSSRVSWHALLCDSSRPNSSTWLQVFAYLMLLLLLPAALGPASAEARALSAKDLAVIANRSSRVMCVVLTFVDGTGR